jgi:sortase A
VARPDDDLVVRLERFREEQRALRAARRADRERLDAADLDLETPVAPDNGPRLGGTGPIPTEPEVAPKTVVKPVEDEDDDPAPAEDALTSRELTIERIRTGIRGVGQTLITLGVVILLFVVYELWVTDIFNQHKQGQLANQLSDTWNRGDDPLDQATVGEPGEPGTTVRSIPLGEGIALIRIPALGLDYVRVVVEGTGEASLAEGPGHYVDSALPGEVGNFAVAGHRVGKGSPFLDLDRLKAGDPIVIETKTQYFIYRVLGDRRTGNPTAQDKDGIPGQEIVDPSEVGVIKPVPDHPGATPTRRFLTLTTCHPRFSARQRMIIHAEQDGAAWPKSKGLPPVLKG